MALQTFHPITRKATIVASLWICNCPALHSKFQVNQWNTTRSILKKKKKWREREREYCIHSPTLLHTSLGQWSVATQLGPDSSLKYQRNLPDSQQLVHYLHVHLSWCAGTFGSVSLVLASYPGLGLAANVSFSWSCLSGSALFLHCECISWTQPTQELAVTFPLPPQDSCDNPLLFVFWKDFLSVNWGNKLTPSNSLLQKMWLVAATPPRPQLHQSYPLGTASAWGSVV